MTWSRVLERQRTGDRPCDPGPSRAEVVVSGLEHLPVTEALAERVRVDEAAAQELGTSGVPTFVVNDKFVVLSARGVDQSLGIFRRARVRRAV